MNDIIGDLDPKIEPWVLYLRNRGFDTVSSCQGGRHSEHATLLPEVLILPDTDRGIEFQSDQLAAAVLDNGGDGFTVRIYQDTMYQRSTVPWRDEPVKILLEFWAQL